ncbi:uncharacterized protein B0T23DRAFT_56810 [Neurospora hispaniola]|uniref:Uncharacterized protein n=1 Tax=Neurospora hispaniola TaxID=588809 RepID=A0AAJ0MLH2_9PEZI|nr:hypothetical protein B0T23DRAFT_56810 [Neurospora hispaniola]
MTVRQIYIGMRVRISFALVMIVPCPLPSIAKNRPNRASPTSQRLQPTIRRLIYVLEALPLGLNPPCNHGPG